MISLIYKIMVLIGGYTAIIFIGSIIVKRICKPFHFEEKIQLSSVPQAGKYIGIFERLLILTLVLIDQYGVIGFVLAAKSVARFEGLKDQRFAEYYLIGTLVSTSIALVGGLGLKWVLGLI